MAQIHVASSYFKQVRPSCFITQTALGLPVFKAVHCTAWRDVLGEDTFAEAVRARADFKTKSNTIKDLSDSLLGDVIQFQCNQLIYPSFS